VAGIGLGVAGAVMQAILRNPLASPYTLVISSGAGFGASLAILAGAGIVGGDYLIIGNAFVFALLCSFIILGLSSRKGATPETMILAGIAMMYLFGAMTTILQYFGEAEAVKEAVFWMVGDLDRSSWPKLTLILDFQRCSEKHYQANQSMYDLSKHKLSRYRFTYFPINFPKSSKENNLACFASISSTTKSTLPLPPVFPCTRATRIPSNSSTSRLRLKPRYLHFHAKYL
jgi:hypothetical protein